MFHFWFYLQAVSLNESDDCDNGMNGVPIQNLTTLWFSQVYNRQEHRYTYLIIQPNDTDLLIDLNDLPDLSWEHGG